MAKSRGGVNPGIKYIVLLIVGLILLVVNAAELMDAHEETIVSSGGPEGASIFFLIFGLVLCLAGVLGMVKLSRESKTRRY